MSERAAASGPPAVRAERDQHNEGPLLSISPPPSLPLTSTPLCQQPHHPDSLSDASDASAIPIARNPSSSDAQSQQQVHLLLRLDLSAGKRRHLLLIRSQGWQTTTSLLVQRHPRPPVPVNARTKRLVALLLSQLLFSPTISPTTYACQSRSSIISLRAPNEPELPALDL